ncbi:MAG: outer membrane beta-barrel protein [Bacteroidota bacterium]
MKSLDLYRIELGRCVLAFSLLCLGCIQAQSLDEYEIKKGTVAFGINSQNLFNVGSDIFSSENSNFQIFDWQNTDSLINLKYFYRDNRCLRISLGLNFKSDKTDEIVQAFDENLFPIEGEITRNIFIDESFRLGLRVGLERNFSYRKWRYFHAAELGFTFSTGRNRIINGNPLPLYLGAVLDDKTNTDFSIGPSMLGGFEYMIGKNASIGVELNWAVNFLNRSFGDRVVVIENSNGQAVELLIEGEEEESEFNIENNPGARIFALIYLPTKKN